jgi:4-hydroxy-2-oxoheptanedioate aldolase
MLKQKLSSGKNVVGIWQRIPSSVVSQILSLSDMDFVSVDMEHGAIDVADLRTMVPILKSAGVPVILRVALTTPAYVSKVLDLGVDGIMVPHVSSAAEANQAVKVSKFPPLGKRGIGGPCAADGYGEMGVDEFVIRENERVTTIIQIENEQAVHNLDDLLEVEGVDSFFIGPFDLSQSLGVTGEVNHPDVVEAIQSVVEKAKSKGKIIGMHAVNADFMKYWNERGVSYFTYGMDSAMLKQAVQEQFKSIR